MEEKKPSIEFLGGIGDDRAKNIAGEMKVKRGPVSQWFEGLKSEIGADETKNRLTKLAINVPLFAVSVILLPKLAKMLGKLK